MNSLSSLPLQLSNAMEALLPRMEIPQMEMPQVPSTEPFVSEEDSKTIVSNVFISVGLMIGAMIITGIFYWAFNKNVLLFITIMSALVFLYTIKVLIITAMMRSNYKSQRMFMTMMGGTVFMCLLSLILTIMFAIKSSSASRSSATPSYIPSNVNDYINQ